MFQDDTFSVCPQPVVLNRVDGPTFAQATYKMPVSVHYIPLFGNKVAT